MKKFTALLKNIKLSFKKPIFWSFLICFIYWAYLFFTTHMIISCDASVYEGIGKLLQQKGWIEFFKTGPQREPFYPFLISIAMRLGDYLSISYQPIITIFQLLLLLLTQLLTLFILRILKIKDLIISVTIIYLGISPAIVNSALSLFSEIAAYPFILSIVLISYYSWLSFNKSKNRAIMLAIIIGILFYLTTLNKAIFEIITPGFIILVFLLSLLTRKQKFILNALIYLSVASVVFYYSIFAYKLANKIFNDNFVITSRGDLKLYGTAIRRTEPLTIEQFFIALAYVPGEGFCQNIFGKEKCSHWAFPEIDEIGYNKLAQLSGSGLKSENVSKITVQLAIKKASEKPLQYTLFWLMEGVKMLFWESTNIGFVSYPGFLDKIFSWKLFKNGLRLSIFILTLISLFYLVEFLWKKLKIIHNVDMPNQEIILIFIAFLIFQFICTYSFFNTVTRYALPIAPLFLIIIAFFLQRVIFKKAN